MRDTEKPAPFISEEVVDYIEKAFPMKDFSANAKHEEMLYHYGQRSVVRFLKHKHVEQNENVLNPTED